MSGRRSKKNQKFGSSRRSNRGLRVNEEKDYNEFDGKDEVNATNQPEDIVLEAQIDHLPSVNIDYQTTSLASSPHAESPMPERKRKIGSTRNKAGGFKSGSNLEPCDELRTTEEFGEEQETQLNRSTTEVEQIYPTKKEQRNAPYDLSQETQGSGFGGGLEVAQNITVTVSQSKETDAIHHQEISSYSQTISLEAGSNMAMEQSTAQSNVVTAAKTDFETLLASSLQKRKMGSTRRPLGGNREQNRENVELQETLRNTTDDVRIAVKSSEAEFNMLEEMMQTWDDVKRKESPTNTSSHTESAFVSNKLLSSERTEELDVSAEIETKNQSVACLFVDPTKPPSDRFSNHETLFLNKESVCFKSDMETEAEDFNVCQNVTDSTHTRSDNVLEEVCGFTDPYQDVPDSRHTTSEDYASVKLVETKEEPCRWDPNIIISSSKQDTDIGKLVVNVEEPLSSLCPLDVATKDGNIEISTDVLTAEVRRISETLESDITHAESTAGRSIPEMTDPGPDSHGLEGEEKETLMALSNDVIINNEVSHAIVPEAENQEIYVEIKEGNDIDVIERSIICDVTVTEIVTDVENFTEQSIDPQTLATRENENVSTKTGPETDALEMKDQDNVENNARDYIIMQILEDERENEEEEGETKDQEQQSASQIQGRPPWVDPDKESYDFIRDTSMEDAKEILLNAKSGAAFDGEYKTCEKYKIIEESEGHGKLDASAVITLDVTERLANVPDNDIRSDLRIEKHSSKINFEALMQDAVTESSLESTAVSEQSEISLIPEDSQGVQKNDGDSEGVAEKEKGPGFQEKNNVIDQNMIQTMMVVKDDENEIVRRSTQELCDDEAGKAEGHAENTSAQQLRFSLNISPKQGCPPQDYSEKMLESEAEEMLLGANSVHAAFDRMIKTNDESKLIEEDFKDTVAAEHLPNVNIQDDANQSDLQTENTEQNKILTEGQNNTSPHINLEERQETQHVEYVSAVTNSGLSFEYSGESLTKLENINEIPEDSQKEDKQLKTKPLVHKRKMGSTRRPLRGNKGQLKDREHDDESETLNNDEKEQEREISGENVTGPLEVLDSTIIQLSCNAEKSTEKSIRDITESQTTTKCHAESQENAGDAESLPAGGDTEAHLEIQTDIQMFDSTIVEGTEENIFDHDVLMRNVEFVGDTFTVESNMTIESDSLQNNTSLNTNQEALKSSENLESVSAVNDTGLLLKDFFLVGSGETEAVSEQTEISITSENSQRDSSSKLHPLAHKRKMGSTRRPLRGNKGQRKDREQDDETINSESLINEEKSTEESIRAITESQTTTTCHADSQQTGGEIESLPAVGETEAHLEIQTDIKMFDSTVIEEGTEENICDDVLMRHVEFVGDTFTVESNMTIESDFLQNITSVDTNQEALRSSENAQSVSAVTDAGLPLRDVLVGSGEKTVMSIISDNSQGDSPSKLSPLAHTRKMGSTRRPLIGNKEKIKSAEEKEDGGSEGVAEEYTDLHSETQEQNNVIDDNIIKSIDASENEEHEITETVRKSTQELCDDAADKAEGHAEISLEQQLRSSSNICQTQDDSPQDDSENMLESEMDIRGEKDEETENTTTNIKATKSEEIFTLGDINSEVTVTLQTQNQLFIQATDEGVHDYIQTVKGVYEESRGDEIFLSANTDAAFDTRNETKDRSKETEDFKEITNIQDSDSQLDLQTENPKQNKVLTEEQNTNTTLHKNPAESQETEHAENVFVVSDSGLSFGDSVESHKELENINEIPEDYQKEEKQLKIKPLVHKRKMGSTRRPLRGNKGQLKDREQDDESETLNNDEKEQEREISGEKVTGPVEELDSTIIQLSCNAEKSTEESIRDITESQTTTKCHAESQENAGDAESLPAGGDTEAHLEIQTEIQMFDSTIVEGTEENIFDHDVLMRNVEFVGDTFTVESNMTIESDSLQNNTSLNTNQEALKSSENLESVSAVNDTGLLLKDFFLVGSGETEAVSEQTEISITSENSQRDSSSKLHPLAHKRKMGSTRRPLRGNKGQRKDREQDDETINSESLINEEKSTEESIRAITESQTTTKCHAESQQTGGEIESLPAVGETEAHLEIQTDIKMFDSTVIEEGTEENICDDVLMRHVEFAGDTFTVESNMTIESDFLQNNTSLDTNQEALRSSENAQSVSAVTDAGLPLRDVLVGSGEKTAMSIISDNSQGDSPSKLSPLAHKRKMGSTRRPLRGNKEKIKSAEEKEDGGSEGVAEEYTDLHSETQEQNNVIDDNIIKSIDASENEEHEITETVRKSTQELCDDAADKAEGHADITLEQQLRSSSNICQTQDDSAQDDSENMLESEMDIRGEKDEETENTTTNIEATKSEEIFTLGDINSEITVTLQTQNQLFIQAIDEGVHDYIQTVKGVYEESRGDEIFLSANTDAAFDTRNETKDRSKETEDFKEITNIHDNDSQLDLQTDDPKQNKVLTEEQNTNTTLHKNPAESQETEHAENVFVVSDFGLSFGDSVESHKELENINEIPEDYQKEEKQLKIKPLVHKRKMGSTRRPLRGNKGQLKDREQDDESETLNNEEKEQEREISGEKVTGPVEELDSTIIQLSCNAEKSTEESIRDITESQTTTKCHAESQENAGDAESLPAEGDTEAHLEIQTEIQMFDSTVEERTKKDLCDNNVLMRQAEFVGDTVTLQSNRTFESDFLQNNTSSDSNQGGLKSSEYIENVLTVINFGLVLQDAAVESAQDSNTVHEKTEISIIPKDSHGEDSNSKLNPVVHKRKMGSTHRPLRGNKDKEDLRESKEEDMDPPSEIQEQNDVIDHDTMQKIMDVRHNEEKSPGTLRISVHELCEHLSENKEWHSDITLEQEQTSSSNISQRQTGPSQDDAYDNLPEIRESNTLFGETKNATIKEDTIKPLENFILEDLMSLTITGTHANQHPSSLSLNKESHDIENNGSKLNNQIEKPDQTEMQEQNNPNSNTNPLQNQIIISEMYHTENIKSNMNPTAQKRKMGSTRKTLRGNGRRTREIESKEIDGDSERTSEEHTTEFATSERESETKLDVNTQFKETRSTESLTHPVATSKIFFETEDGVKKMSTNIVALSLVSEEIQSNEAPSEAFSTNLQSEMFVSANKMKGGKKYNGPSELENVEKSKSLEEVESEHQLQLTVLEQSHQLMPSEKHPRSETVTPERRRKMGSTRKNLGGKREKKKREESESNQFAPEEDQASAVQEAKCDQIIYDSVEHSDNSLLSEIERALKKTSLSSQNTDYQLIINEPNLAKTPVETSHFNTPENSEPEQGSGIEKYVSLQVTESQNPSEISSPGRRRKMGSTRKNPRQQLQAKREDENKDDEEDEMEDKNKQETKSLKKDLEAVAEESKVHDTRDNEENKKYLDIPVTLTNSSQTEESTNSVGQEGTSPSTKRKFGSRRTNIGQRDLGGLTPPESNDDLTEDTGAQLVSLDQMIRASQHDGSPGKKQTVLKNISDMEVVQFNVVMVGNSSVGKTSFVRRFHGGEFSLDYTSTIGVDTCVQNVVLHDRVVKLQIWDTAGQERFHSITTQVFHRADGLILMYDITSSKSFISVRDWISQVQEKAPDDVIMMLLGNKRDCAGREIQVQEGEDLAREYKINFLECSAATGDNVSECMKSLAEMLVLQKRQKMEEHKALKRDQPQKKSGCC